jgi:hypothetical protein
MVLVVWRYFIADNGEQSVIIIGISMMPELYVVNLDIHMLSQRFEEAMSQMASGEYG